MGTVNKPIYSPGDLYRAVCKSERDRIERLNGLRGNENMDSVAVGGKMIDALQVTDIRVSPGDLPETYRLSAHVDYDSCDPYMGESWDIELTGPSTHLPGILAFIELLNAHFEKG